VADAGKSAAEVRVGTRPSSRPSWQGWQAWQWALGRSCSSATVRCAIASLLERALVSRAAIRGTELAAPPVASRPWLAIAAMKDGRCCDPGRCASFLRARGRRADQLELAPGPRGGELSDERARHVPLRSGPAGRRLAEVQGRERPGRTGRRDRTDAAVAPEERDRDRAADLSPARGRWGSNLKRDHPAGDARFTTWPVSGLMSSATQA